ncbi:MAG: type II toxin-antitoxin system Phd/YefM family antitoxin [Flavobacteriaceae bacterium]|nr:type II toxin-antitoxin system Phd/YefM family antitoxin [Flavobacteriaceae bacterium]
MKTITSSTLRSRMKYFLDLVTDSLETIVIPRSNEDDGIVIMPLSEYNSLIETNYLTSTENNRARLSHSLKEIENNDLIETDL